ncbi:MAG: hypothetical protein R3F43_06775 [bacterium]
MAEALPAVEPVSGLNGGVAAQGQIGRTTLRVERIGDAQGSGTFSRIIGSGSIPPDLELAPETVTAAVGKLLRGRDIEVGDAVFDRRMVVRGEEAVVRALLDDATRAAILEAPRVGFRVAAGKVTVEQPGSVNDPGEGCGWPGSASGSLALATPELDARLEQAALASDDADAALAAFHARMKRGADARFAERACASPHAAVRLAAARRRGSRRCPCCAAWPKTRRPRLRCGPRLSRCSWIARGPRASRSARRCWRRRRWRAGGPLVLDQPAEAGARPAASAPFGADPRPARRPRASIAAHLAAWPMETSMGAAASAARRSRRRGGPGRRPGSRRARDASSRARPARPGDGRGAGPGLRGGCRENSE